MIQSSPSLPLRSLRFLVPLLLLSALALALLYRKGELKPKAPPEQVTVAFTTLPFAALAQIAQARGYFEQEGLQVNPLRFPYGKPCLQAVLEGKADFATVAETPVMFAVMNGERLSIVATIHSSAKSHGIVARREGGVRTPYDLRGKVVGVPLGTSAHFFLDVFLVSHGIPLGGVHLVDLKPDALAGALQKGEVDAICAFDPFVSMARKALGDKGETFYDEDIYRETFNVVGRTAFVEQNPGKVRKVLRALIRAQEFVSGNPGEAQRTVAEGTGVDLELVRSTWGGGVFQVALDQSLVLALEDESRWAVGSQLPGATIPNYLNTLYVQGLDSVQPQAVKILR